MSIRVTLGRAVLFTVIGVLSAAACETSDESPSNETTAMVIGPDGGTLVGPGGAKLVVPARALTADTRLSITRVHTGYPEFVSGKDLVSSVFAFEPHGQGFAEVVTISIPFTHSTSDVQMVSAAPGGTWSTSSSTARDGVAQTTSSHFSFYAVIV